MARFCCLDVWTLTPDLPACGTDTLHVVEELSEEEKNVDQSEMSMRENGKKILLL